MKNITTLITVILLITVSAFTIENTCESFFPQKVGSSWEMTSYDAKDKTTSKSISTLTTISDLADGLEATINIEVFDDKNKSMSKGDVIMQCTGDKFLMDMSNMFPKETMAGMEGMGNVSIEISDQYLEFPAHPTVGQTLPDASSTMTIKMGDVAFMTMKINTTNRKIEGIENVTTPAGTFSCYKYTSDSEVSSTMFKSKSTTVMYMAKNVGSVKTETFDEKGKFMSKQLLTSFTN